MSKFYKKYIRIPPNESIDIREIMPIINHPLFQRLLYISQLGTTLAVFPGATHNRFEHALGVYRKAKRFCKKMAEGGFLNKREVKNVPLFGLMHDIGHGPFSHGIEELTSLRGDENENGLIVLKQMKDAVIKSGGDYELIKKMFKHQTSLYNIIMDKNVGMDKLDYLERDTYHTGFGQRPDTESLFNYLVYLKGQPDNVHSDALSGQLVIDKKSLEAAKQMQRLYIYMYKEVYLHKSALISQRFLQKMIQMLIQLNKLDPSELWKLTDNELLALIYTNKNEDLTFLYTCYKNRSLPRTGLVIRLKNREFKERIAGKKIKVIGEDSEFFEKLMSRATPEDLERLESKIGNLIKVPAHKIVIVPTLTPWRFVPQDILYHDNGRILSLKDTQKEYFEALKSEMSDYLAVRVCIVGDRDVIYRNSFKIYQLVKKENG